MRKRWLKYLAMGLTVSMLFSLAACGGEDATNPSGETESQSAPAIPVTEGVEPESTSAGEEAAVPVQAAESNTEQTPGRQTRETPQSVLPTSKAEILALYTAVMNKAKSERPAYRKVEYQEITEKNFDSAAVNMVLSLASKFMTTPEEAEEDPEIHEKGADVTYFPVYEGSAGCLMAPGDAEKAIQSATCRELPNGNYEIVITLNAETDPEPLISYHGQMFSPISRKVIDTEVEKLSVVHPEYYSIRYHDCTATLVLNPDTQQVVSLQQMMYCLITAKGTIDAGPIHFNIDGTAALQNTLRITDFQY